MRSRSRVHPSLALIGGLVASLALAGVVLAAETTLTATLSGDSEGELAGDPDGSGTAHIVLDPDAGTACWALEAEGIEPVTQSHIHVGAAGEAGDVVVPLDVDGFEGSSEGCTEGQEADVLQAIIDDPAGYYVNLHTEEFPPGAIRGQLAAAPPNTALGSPVGPIAVVGALLLGLGMAIGLRARRPISVRG